MEDLVCQLPLNKSKERRNKSKFGFDVIMLCGKRNNVRLGKSI